jgi:predicted chitinase
VESLTAKKNILEAVYLANCLQNSGHFKMLQESPSASKNHFLEVAA